MKFWTIGLAALSLAAGAALPAQAASYVWFFGNDVVAGGTFTVDPSGNVTSGTGIFGPNLRGAAGIIYGTLTTSTNLPLDYSQDFPISKGLLFTDATGRASELIPNGTPTPMGGSSAIKILTSYNDPAPTASAILKPGVLDTFLIGDGTYGWFAGTGSVVAGGVITTDDAGHVISGNATVFTSSPTAQELHGTILPGAGSDGGFTWDNAFPIDNAGLLFDFGANKRVNLYMNSGTLGEGAKMGAGFILGTANSQRIDILRTGTMGIVAFPKAAVAAVPEPSTWALLIMGFGGAGALLRRRRSALA